MHSSGAPNRSPRYSPSISRSLIRLPDFHSPFPGRSTKIPSGQNYDAVAAACGQGDSVQLPGGFEGGLAEELGNIQFLGEREAAILALIAFGRYKAVDDKIRSL